MSESVDIFKQRSIEESWNIAKGSYSNWKSYPADTLANQIAQTAVLNGNYSIWFEVFKDEKKVLGEIINAINNKIK